MKNSRKCTDDPFRALLFAIGALSLTIIAFGGYFIWHTTNGQISGLYGSAGPRTRRHIDSKSSGLDRDFAMEVLDSFDRLEALSHEIREGQLAMGSTAGERKVQAAPPAPKRSRTNVGSRRNAVVGMAKNIDFLFLYRFARSLRESCGDSSVDVVLFTDVSREDLDFAWLLREYRITALPIDSTTLSPKYANYHPSSYRWIMIRDWMKTVQDPYDAVLLTDVRDTVFQADPFKDMSEPGFYAFLEAKPGTIAQCGWNSGWVKDCFGQAALQSVGHNIVSCSGTSMATWKHAMIYADMMAEEIASNPCERNGVDQGMHNYFVYGGKLRESLGPNAKLHLITNEEGWIATVQSMPELHRDKGGYVLNNLEQRVAVVHQYDRSAALKEQYDRQYIWLQSHELNRK